MRISIISILAISILILSCSKDEQNSSEEFSFNIQLEGYGNDTIELILQDTLNRILEDTLLLKNTNYTIKYKGESEKVNLTIINKSSYYKRTIESFYGVVPGEWVVPLNNFNYLGETHFGGRDAASTPSTIQFINGPNGEYLTSVTNSFTANNNNGDLEISYSCREDGEYLYYVEPANKQYCLAKLGSNDTTIDLSQLSPTQESTINVNLSIPLTMIVKFVGGFPDKNDLSRDLSIYSGNVGAYDTNLFIFPVAGIEEYITCLDFMDEEQNHYVYYTQSENIPTEIELLNPSYIRVLACSISNVSLEFPEGDPTYCSVQMSNEDIFVNNYFPPTFGSYNPQAFISSISNASLLQGLSLTNFKIPRIIAEKDDEFGYQDLLDYSFTPNPAHEEMIKCYRRILIKQ